MKTIQFLLACMIVCCSCNLFSNEKRKTEDSLRYYPPTPAVLSKPEFRNYIRTLNGFFDSTLLRTNFNGGILVAKQGAILYEKYVGKSDLRKNDPISDSTSLHLASTSKTFTAIAILHLVNQQKLSLDDSLNHFFPGIPYPGISIRMLLNHRSGLPNYIHFIPNSDWDQKQTVTNNDVVNLLYTLQPRREFAPNTRFSYSNTNFVLLAMIVEKISGQPFPLYMQDNFFKPLQMNHTYVFTMADSLKATPSFEPNGTFWKFDFLEGTYGDKNIYSTPRDLLKWDQALYTDQLVSQALLDSAFKPYSFEKKSVHNYGLGFRLQLLPNGKKVIYHFGRWHGFNAAFARLLDEKVVIIILGNRFNRAIYNTAHLSYDLFGNYFQSPANREEEENDTTAIKKTHRHLVEKKSPHILKRSPKRKR